VENLEEYYSAIIFRLEDMKKNEMNENE